ncbi:MAG: imidazolonepropionase [Flavobacteriaceae bacterium]|nr:imidazolonepropionase [Flavobacteriaceae bacterium]
MKTLFGPFTQILTMSNMAFKGSLSDEQLRIIKNGGIIVEGDRIVEVGNFSDLKHMCKSVHEIEFECIILPGLIDCHTHICFAGSRANEYSKKIQGINYQQILSEGGGIYQTMEQTELNSDEELKKLTLSRLKRHFFEGVLTCEVKSGYGMDLIQERRLLKVINQIEKECPTDIIPTCLAAHVPPKNKNNLSREYLKLIVKELFPALKKENLAKRVDVFIEKNAFNINEAEEFLNSARQNGFDITAHTNQFSSGGLSIAVKSGALSVDHLEVISDEEIKLLSNSDTTGVVLPGCSLGLGLPFAPARKILDSGCKLAIATDWNPGSAPMGDLLMQASILASNQKLNNAEIFSGLTYRSANALGLNDRGIIEPNRIADFIGFKLPDYREILYNQGKIKPSFICKRGEVYDK